MNPPIDCFPVLAGKDYRLKIEYRSEFGIGAGGCLPPPPVFMPTDEFKLKLRFMLGRMCLTPTDVLPPDGESTTTAEIIGEIPTGAQIKWEIVGDPEVAKIEAQPGSLSAKITAGTRPGLVWIRAYDTQSCCFCFAVPLQVGCVDCQSGSGACGFGAATMQMADMYAWACEDDCSGSGAGLPDSGFGSPLVSFSMGQTIDGESAGRLWLFSPNANTGLSTPEALQFYLSHPDVTTERDPDTNALTKITAPQGVAEITSTGPDTYEIKFRGNDVGQTEHVVWKIQAPDAWQSTLQRWVGGALDVQYEYSAISYAGGWTWALDTGDGTIVSRAEDHAWSWDFNDLWTRWYSVHQDGGFTYRVEDTYTGYAWGRVLTQSVVDPLVLDLTTTYEYGQSGNELGRLISQTNPDGSWIAYLYDAQGRVTGEIRPWEDLPAAVPATPAIGDGQSVEYIYYTSAQPDVDPNDVGELPNRPRIVKERVGNTVVAKTFLAYWIDDNGTPGVTTDDFLVEVSKRCPDVTASYGDAGNLTTTTTYRDVDGDDIDQIDYPDGRVDDYDYDADETGSYTFTPGATPPWAAPTYDPAGLTGSYRYVTVEHEGASGPVTNKSTMDTSIYDPAGNLLLQETWVYTGSAYDTRVSWIANGYDLFGRLEEVYGSDGTLTEYAWQSCCNQSSVTSADGTVTDYVHDILGRVKTSTKQGTTEQQPITTTYAYDYNSQTQKPRLTTTVSGGSLSLFTVQEYDLARRLTTQTDEADMETTYTYGLGAGGGRKVTKLFEDGSDEITEYYRDGRVESVTGSAVVAQAYIYALNGTGQRITTAYTGSLGTGSPRWSVTTSDALGRQLSQERQAYPSETVTTTYEYRAAGQQGAGQIKKVSPPGQAPTLYEYNAMGGVFRSGLDLDANDVLDLVSDDRITETTSQYLLSGDWWMETTTKIYYAANSAASKTPSVQRTRLTGLGTVGANGALTAESASVNMEGKTTFSRTEIDRANKLVTATTDYPDAIADSSSQTENGLLQSQTSSAGITVTFGYDDLGRQTTVTDPRIGDTVTVFDVATGQMTAVEKHGATAQDIVSKTVYAYFGTGVANAGRVKSVGRLKADDPQDVYVYTYYDYDTLGQVLKVWGDVPQPVQVEFDGYGQRSKLHTYRGGSNWSDPDWSQVTTGTADTTTWAYHEPTGLLETKTYADASSVAYTYETDGKLATRVWARGAPTSPTTTYTYDPGTAELTNIDYTNDGGATPDVVFTYTRLGRASTTTDGLGTRTFLYDNSLRPHREIISGSLYAKRITREYFTLEWSDEQEGWVQVNEARLRSLQVGTSGDPDADYKTDYTYESTTGRLATVSGPGLPSGGAAYSYRSDANLLDTLEYKEGANVEGDVTRVYEAYRNLITSVENRWGSPLVPVSKYSYAYDLQGRPESEVREGPAFGADHHDAWGYNDRSELTGSDRYDNTTPGSTTNPVPALDRAFEYDNIGNREWYDEGTAARVNYCSNELNQYATLDDTAVCPPTSPDETLTYDLDGNLTADGSYTYEWDAENRLVRLWLVDPDPQTLQEGDRKLEFVYDFMGRRVQNVDKLYASGAWTTQLDRRFVWDGWLMVLELDGLASNLVYRKYTWGLDLSGSSRSAAGGIGGLLAIHDVDDPGNPSDLYGDFAVFYDRMGNVGQLVDISDGSTAAKYEYDAYGNVVASGGSYATENPIRFSTKYFDAESGLGYWGLRYYDPRLGRWVNRDPIQELGGANLYAYVTNQPSADADPLGLRELRGYEMCLGALFFPRKILDQANIHLVSTDGIAGTNPLIKLVVDLALKNNAAAITIGNDVYFRRRPNTRTPIDLGTLIHELRHVQQYDEVGGVANFLKAYIWYWRAGVGGLQGILSGKGQTAYERIPFENDARVFENCFFDLVLGNSELVDALRSSNPDNTVCCLTDYNWTKYKKQVDSCLTRARKYATQFRSVNGDFNFTFLIAGPATGPLGGTVDLDDDPPYRRSTFDPRDPRDGP